MNLFLVMTRRLPGFDASRLDDHYAFLDSLRSEGRLALAGPFADGSGGAYLLRAASLEEATETAHRDPLHRHLCSELQVLQWNAR